MTDLTPIDIASAGLVSGSAGQEEDLARQFDETVRNDLQKPEDQVLRVPQGGVQAPTGDAPSDIPHDRILPKAADRSPSQYSTKSLAVDETSSLEEKGPRPRQDEGDGRKYQHKSKLRDLSDSDALLSEGKKRERWFQIWRPKYGPRKAPKSLEDAEVIPLAQANFLSQLFYSVS